DQVLDPDAVFAGLVVAGLVGDDHARLERHAVRRLGDAVRAFMHREIAADAMPGAVVVIEPDLPERPAGQHVEAAAGGALRELHRGERDVAFEHAGEAILHLRGWRADRDGARDVGGAIEILAAGIDQVDRVHLDLAAALLRDLVMDDCAVRPGARDGVEAEVAEEIVLAPELRQLLRRADLGEATLRRLAGEPGQELRDRSAVAAMRRPRAFDLHRILARLRQRAGIVADPDRGAALLQPVADPDT